MFWHSEISVQKQAFFGLICKNLDRLLLLSILLEVSVNVATGFNFTGTGMLSVVTADCTPQLTIHFHV